MRRAARHAVVVAFAVVGSVTAVGVVATAPAAGRAEAAAPPEHRVAVFADSVGLGARSAIPAAFPADWSVHVDGQPARFVEQLEDDFVKYRLAVNPEWFGDHVVIAGGYNYPYWDPARFERSIDSIIDTLTAAGVEHVYWVTLREVKPQYVSGAGWRQIQPYYWYFPTVNDHLERALDRHPNLTLVDWAAAADRPGLTYDAIHLNNEGAALYAQLVRATVASSATKVAEGSTTRIPIPEPHGVSAVAVNLTTVRPRHRGFLTAYDCDRPRPEVSNHNFVRDQTVAHATIVPVGPSGQICVYSSRATDLVVDLTGRFTVDLADGASSRLLDTRKGAGRQRASVAVVVDVGTTDTVAFTVTAVGATQRSWVRVAACDDDSATSNVNMNGPDPVPNAAVVRPGPDGTVCVVTSADAHLLLDRLAGFPDGGLTAGAAQRAFDSRDGSPLAAGDTLRLTGDDLGLDAAGGPMSGVLLNLTATRSQGIGFVTAFGCADGEPETSSLNLAPGVVVANFLLVSPDAAGEICLRTTAATDLVVDVQGNAGLGFEGRADRLLDTRR